MKSKQKKSASIVSTKIDDGAAYCRKCSMIKSKLQFYDTTDMYLDSNGCMSVCKDCAGEIYTQIFETVRSHEKAILRMCQLFNVKYDQTAIDAAVKHLETVEGDVSRMFGAYKSKLYVLNRGAVGVNAKQLDLTYNFPTNIIINAPEDSHYGQEVDDLREFWGDSFSPQELEKLERKSANWRKSHAIDTNGEEVLLRLICIKELEIDKAISTGQPTASLIKEFQDLLKTSALSPSMSNAASGGKSMEAFGVWIKEIESMTPAEWIKDRSIWKDIDNIEEYGEKYITSPLRSFVTGSREFTLDDDSEGDDSTSAEE